MSSWFTIKNAKWVLEPHLRFEVAIIVCDHLLKTFSKTIPDHKDPLLKFVCTPKRALSLIYKLGRTKSQLFLRTVCKISYKKLVLV